MEKLTVQEAKRINDTMVTEEHLELHAANVAACMGAMAQHFNEDKEHWEAIGYLHDYDYEKYPKEHLAQLVTYLCRALPLTLMRKPIENQFVQSFLYYVPYVTLAVMTFPAVIQVTQTPAAGAGAMLVGIILAWFGASLFKVAAASCIAVLVIEAFLI